MPSRSVNDAALAAYEKYLDGTGTTAGQTQGNTAAAAADSGNPVKIGAVFRSTRPTYTDGQRGDAQADNRGNLAVAIFNGATPAGIATASVTTLIGAASAGLNVVNHNYKSDGTGWRADTRPSAASRIPSAAASTNATVAKASAGDIHRVTGYNAAATVRYLKLYNKATAPTVGTDTPVLTLALKPLDAFNIEIGGYYCSAGISYALTTGAADADTGAVTAADIVGLNVLYT